MDQRQMMYNKTYADALRINEGETQRWNTYRQEHLDLKGNLRMYQKSPRTDILIPIGSKALLPGQLYHTGEVLVSHGGGYFSECSSEQAQTIADRRIRLADEMLQNYERERTLYSDKLEQPFISEAFADGGREIIEPYDEQAEERWRAEHRIRVRESKKKEATERAQEYQDDKELFEKLEEMELLEELEQEMDQLEMPDDDDQLGRLMRGEIQYNSKQRTAHQQDAIELWPNTGDQVNENGKQTLPVDGGKAAVQRANSADKEESETTISDEELVTTDEEGSADGCDDEDISQEFAKLLKETKNLSKEEKIQVFQGKLKNIRNQLYQNTITIVEKVDLYQLYEELEEALDFLQSADEPNDAISSDKESESTQPAALTNDPKNSKKEQRRKISFAEHDDIKLIDDRLQGLAIRESKNHFATSDKTLFLPIVHSAETLSNVYRETAQEGEIICPADIYRLFEQSQKVASSVKIKSILKNKHSVEKNPLNGSNSLGTVPSNHKPKQHSLEDPTPVDIMGDIVEHKVDPEGGLSPAFGLSVAAPQQKKKVSKFKNQRR